MLAGVRPRPRARGRCGDVGDCFGVSLDRRLHQCHILGEGVNGGLEVTGSPMASAVEATVEDAGDGGGLGQEMVVGAV